MLGLGKDRQRLHGIIKGEDAEKLYLRPSKKDFVEMAHQAKKKYEV